MIKRYTQAQLQEALQHGIGDPSFSANLIRHLDACVVEHLPNGKWVTVTQLVRALNAVAKTLRHLTGEHFEIVVDYQKASNVVLSAVPIGLQKESLDGIVETAADEVKKQQQRMTNASRELRDLFKTILSNDGSAEDWKDGLGNLRYPEECKQILKAVQSSVVADITAGTIQLLLNECRSELKSLPSRHDHTMIFHIQMCREISTFVCEFEFELREVVAPPNSPAVGHQKFSSMVVDEELRGILVEAFKLKSDVRLTAKLLDVPLVEDPRVPIKVEVLTAAHV